MIKILFVCHGNICRSPMAEFLLKDFVKKNNKENEFYIESAATSSEEIGNGVHWGTKNILNSLGIDCSKKRARKIVLSDYQKFDYIIGMDEYNVMQMKHFFRKDDKINMLLEFTGISKGISDPWYTGDFESTYNDVMIGIQALYKHIFKEK